MKKITYHFPKAKFKNEVLEIPGKIELVRARVMARNATLRPRLINQLRTWGTLR